MGQDRRIEMHELFCAILGTREVYFQPPESVNMSYPAIVYNLSSVTERYANDKKYSRRRVYDVILIDRDPDTELLDKILNISRSKLVRSYRADNLNHFQIRITY